MKSLNASNALGILVPREWGNVHACPLPLCSTACCALRGTMTAVLKAVFTKKVLILPEISGAGSGYDCADGGGVVDNKCFYYIIVQMVDVL